LLLTFQERDFDKHVAYCRDEPVAQEFLQENDAVRDYFEVSPFASEFELGDMPM
jgi:hypothetical protein